MSNWRNYLLLAIGTAGGAGFSPIAPGTAGSVVGVLLLLLTRPEAEHLLFWALAVFAIGVPVATRCEQILGRKDPGEIVIDEVVGMWVTMLFLPIDVVTLGTALIAFRVFDIWKPWPVRVAERQLAGGLGVMADDVVAAVYAHLSVRAVLGLLEAFGRH